MKIKKRDYHRVLLTEVLPYEIPLWFSNRELYRFHKGKELENSCSFVRAVFDRKTQFYTPYKYSIKKNATGTRQLSIVHPLKQLDFVDFYERYDELILSFCERSPVSLRYPKRVASVFYEANLKRKISKLKDKEIETEDDQIHEHDQFSSSYFSYADFSFLYKFYDSYKFNRLEKKFCFITRFDIGNCFNSVYTHSIGWATRGKRFVKETKHCHTFESAFDSIMQDTKSRETNGIVIGPEFSRIFAEIILQKIDLKIVEEVKHRLNLEHEVHYSLKRYIDDYFLFIKTEEQSKKILPIVEELLAEFNFSLNPSKTITLLIPHVSHISIAKTQINTILDELNRLVESSLGGECVVLSKTSSLANKYIHQIKTIIVGCGIASEGISNFLFARLRGIVFKFLTIANALPNNQANREKTGNIALVIFDMFFYFYCVDARPRATFVLSEIVSQTLKEKQFSGDAILREMIQKKLSDEISVSVSKISDDGENFGIELINTLHIHKQLGKEYMFDSKKLSKLTGIEKRFNMKSLDYFQIVSILQYIENEPQYIQIKEDISKYVVEYYSQTLGATENADGFCLLFDILSCPYIEKKYKQEVVKAVYKSLGSTNISKVGEAINYINSRCWFTSWGDTMNIQDLLEKFELNPAY